MCGATRIRCRRKLRSVVDCSIYDVGTRVYKTGGNNRSNRSGPVPVWAGRYQTDTNSKFEFEFKKNEKFLKILQGATNLMVSNFLKNSFV